MCIPIHLTLMSSMSANHSHSHSHAHSPGHSHGHSHSVANYNRAFAIGITLNIVFVAIEAVYGFLAQSLALLADAGHNLSDVASLLLAWVASILARKIATEKRTYGLRKVTILASLLSALMLMFVLVGIAWEASTRFLDPAPVQGAVVVWVAAIGVVINTVTALLFFKGQQHDLNIRGAFLHMAADAAVSLAVVIAGVVIMFKGWLWIDPVLSLLIVAVIFWGTWGLLRDSFNYAMDAVPDNVDVLGIKEFLQSLSAVEDIHDLHVWPLSTTEVALTVHLVVDHEHLDNEFLSQVQQHLHDHFEIEHATIQVETARAGSLCVLDGHSVCR